MFLDVFIVYTIFRFGRDKMSNPFIRKYYFPILIFGLIASFAIQYTFITEVGFENVNRLTLRGTVPAFIPGDKGGSYSGYGIAFMMGILFIFMLTERNSLEGQSFIIALAMMLGNAAVFPFLVILNEVTPLLVVLFVLTLFVNALYAIMTYRKSVELGINPWARW
jgi:fucose 4-O-acetylase-like acetyltransferase